jgi:hypothetical protein
MRLPQKIGQGGIGRQIGYDDLLLGRFHASVTFNCSERPFCGNFVALPIYPIAFA